MPRLKVDMVSGDPDSDRPDLAGASLRQAVEATARSFAAGGIDTAVLDARLLVCMAGRASHERLVAAPDQLLSWQQAALLQSLTERRLSGEPVARLLGHKEFWGREFRLGPDTLVPRPDTETLVAAALRLMAASDAPARPQIADLGTGSGCLLVTLLAEQSGAVGIGTDISMNALRVARANAILHKVAARSLFVCGDFLEAISGPFDIIVTNPPYIESETIQQLQPEVARYEPLRALDGGADGLDWMRHIAKGAGRILKPGGHFLAEIGLGQQYKAAEILRAEGLELNDSIGFLNDNSGRVRVVHAVNRTAKDR